MVLIALLNPYNPTNLKCFLLDAIASPSTCPCQSVSGWVSQWVIVSDLANNTINEMLSFYFSKKNLISISRFETRTRIFFFKSRSSRRERDFFLNISGFETRARFFLSTSQGSRREQDIFFQSLMF